MELKKGEIACFFALAFTFFGAMAFVSAKLDSNSNCYCIGGALTACALMLLGYGVYKFYSAYKKLEETKAELKTEELYSNLPEEAPENDLRETPMVQSLRERSHSL